MIYTNFSQSLYDFSLSNNAIKQETALQLSSVDCS